MKILSPMPAGFMLILWGLLFPMTATAHSNEVVEAALQAKEPHVQFVNHRAPPFHLEDLSGARWELSELSDITLIVNFAYARCREECASHMALIAELQQMVNSAQMTEQVRFITIATDNGTTAETKAQMGTFAERFGLDPENWVLVHGGAEAPDAGIRLAEQFDVTPTQHDGTWKPALVTHVIDRTGQVRARFQGLEFQPINLVSYANTLVYDVHADRKDNHSPDAGPSRHNARTRDALISGGVLLSGVLAAWWWYRRGWKTRK